MTNFEKITETPKTLAELLASLMVINSPWEDAFRKKFCDICIQENCGEGKCPNEAARNNPLWWLNQEADGERTARRPVWRDEPLSRLMMEPGVIIPLENPLRVHIRALKEDPVIAVVAENAETRLETALRAAEEVKKAYPDAEISVEVDA